MPLSFSPNKSKSCQIHGTFMVVSWQFHGIFTSKSDLSTVCQSPLKQRVQKIGFSCRFVFLLDFSMISAKCQTHVGFMALSWHFLHPDFCFFLKKSKSTTEFISKMTIEPECQIHRKFIADSRHFRGSFMSASQLCRIRRGFVSFSKKVP